MDAKYFREKAELCLRLADGLSLNNPDRFQLMDLADDFLEHYLRCYNSSCSLAIFAAIRRASSVGQCFPVVLGCFGEGLKGGKNV